MNKKNKEPKSIFQKTNLKTKFILPVHHQKTGEYDWSA